MDDCDQMDPQVIGIIQENQHDRARRRTTMEFASTDPSATSPLNLRLIAGYDVLTYKSAYKNEAIDVVAGGSSWTDYLRLTASVRMLKSAPNRTRAANAEPCLTWPPSAENGRDAGLLAS